MRIKDVYFVNCDFALFISINFIIANERPHSIAQE
jgi:hypothetical protein